MTGSVSKPSSRHSHFENVRKRVCKACDRCRLKKSKCDGATPCSRCRADNSICIFGKRKKTHEKVYPKGYVEKLEQQQVWLVHGLQALYHCSAGNRPLAATKASSPFSLVYIPPPTPPLSRPCPLRRQHTTAQPIRPRSRKNPR